jgi:hypothetical protein
MRIEPFREYYKDWESGAADISEFSVDIFKLNLSTKLQHDTSNERALGKTLPRVRVKY